jgi:dTDP-4-amino-4,6-dideoxygalactose transaminase
MKTIPMIDLNRLHAPIRSELQDAFEAVLDSGQFIQGEYVEKFEAELREYVGVDHAIGVSSGTDALLVSLMALGLRPEDEVITTPYTFVATAEAIVRAGGRPVFVDIDPKTFNIDPRLIEDAITSRTVGIIPVHLFGRTAAMLPILEIAIQDGLWVLEDASQSIGARYFDKASGSMGQIGTFSFFPSKNLGALGDAGAVVTNNHGLAEKIRALRNHGSVKRYHHDEIGGNFRLDALQTAFLSCKLRYLPKWIKKRRQVADRYRELLSDVWALSLPPELEGRHHVYNQFVVRVRTDKRDEIRFELKKAGISSAVYYPTPLHLQPVFAYLGHGPGSFPESEKASRESLALPMDPNLSEDDQKRIAQVVIKTLTT